MANRGRGLLEVQKSANPFFQTVNGEYGVNVAAQVASRDKISLVPGDKSGLDVDKKYENEDEDFAFLYQRTSDKFGSTVPKGAPREYTISKADLARKRRETIKMLETIIPPENTAIAAKPTSEEIERTLTSWNQPTKYEDPRYTTANNQIGFKPPTVATYVSERFGVGQDFSRSFNGIKPTSGNLNCGITKSTVHDSLNPQFA